MKSSKLFEISRGSNQQRRKCSSQKLRTTKENASHLERNCRRLWEFYIRLYEDNEKDDFEHEIDDRGIPEITTEELCKTQSANSKKENPQTAMEFVPKTSKHATMRREKW